MKIQLISVTPDDVYTAPFWGFRDAEDYYHRASALRAAERIRIPALFVTVEDDPFVPTTPFRDPALGHNPHVQLPASQRNRATTATGRRGRSSSSPERSRQGVHQQPRDRVTVRVRFT